MNVNVRMNDIIHVNLFIHGELNTYLKINKMCVINSKQFVCRSALYLHQIGNQGMEYVHAI